MIVYEIDDGHRGVRRTATSWRRAYWIAMALSLGGTAVVWKDTDPTFMATFRLGKRLR